MLSDMNREEKAHKLSHELRMEMSPDLRRRRGIVGLSLPASATMGLVALYQTGVIRQRGDPVIFRNAPRGGYIVHGADGKRLGKQKWMLAGPRGAWSASMPALPQVEPCVTAINLHPRPLTTRQQMRRARWLICSRAAFGRARLIVA